MILANLVRLLKYFHADFINFLNVYYDVVYLQHQRHLQAFCYWFCNILFI